ncbi:MAG: tetratricopeptide repeat protein [Elusimicrobia bacterium]|nr:tetratricopeptide repeat protein [Elusimicrobiota bacterium]
MKTIAKPAQLYSIMGDIHYRTGNLTEALENYKKAGKADPENAAAYNKKIKSVLKKGKKRPE